MGKLYLSLKNACHPKCGELRYRHLQSLHMVVSGCKQKYVNVKIYLDICFTGKIYISIIGISVFMVYLTLKITTATFSMKKSELR